MQTIGFDIGGTNLKAACVDDRLQVVAFEEVPSLATVDPSSVRDSLVEIATKFRDDGFEADAIGIGCAGSIDPVRGVVRTSPNFRGWNQVPLKEWIEADCKLPTTVHNDANCAAVTEHQIGNGRGHRSLMLVTLGTGIGGGLILDDKLFFGHTGTGGEIGHFSVDPTGPVCGCGMKGCFERLCSSSAVERKLGVSSIEVFSKARRAEFAGYLEGYFETLTTGLAGLCNLFDPEAVLLGGAMSAGLVDFIETVRTGVKKKVFPAIAENLRIDFAAHGNQSGALGAALLARKATYATSTKRVPVAAASI